MTKKKFTKHENVVICPWNEMLWEHIERNVYVLVKVWLKLNSCLWLPCAYLVFIASRIKQICQSLELLGNPGPQTYYTPINSGTHSFLFFLYFSFSEFVLHGIFQIYQYIFQLKGTLILRERVQNIYSWGKNNLCRILTTIISYSRFGRAGPVL